MHKIPAIADVKQFVMDTYLIPNAYMLITKYVLRDGKKHPFALLCPGGGYYAVCNCIEGKPIAKLLNEKGISVFILYYHVREKALYPAPMNDLARAVKEIMTRADEFNVDTSNYSVWGGSAGGHLVSSFGTDNMGYLKYGLPKPGALVLSYPVISMMKDLTHMDSHDRLIGKNATEEQERFASVDQHVTSDYPATYIWCGDADTEVKPENTKVMVKSLQQAAVPMAYDVFPGAGHGIGPGTGTSAEGWVDKAVSFWQSQAQS